MHIAIALTESSTVSTVAGAYDLIDYSLRTSVNDERETAVFGVSPCPTDRFGFLPLRSCREAPRADWIFVPALEVDDHWMPDRYRPLADWLRQNAQRGATISAVGTGTFLLAEAGLLDGEAVTHPNFAALFARRYPDLLLRSDVDWLQHGAVELSGNTPWYELVLATIARLMGTATAHRAAEVYALEWHHLINTSEGEKPCGDPVIAQARQWLSKHFQEHDLVERCAREVGLSRRSLNRRFKEETGITPMNFVLRIRIRASQNLLKFTSRSIEAISYEMGYQDTATFRKLFRRSTGMPPGEFRKSLR